MFAAIGGLLAYFHALVHVLANFAVAVGCAAIAAARLFADTGDAAVVVASLLLVLGLNLGVPFGIHALVHSLHTELRSSDFDPLTGLPNRRSFFNSVHEMLLERRGERAEVNVTMIDIDDFQEAQRHQGARGRRRGAGRDRCRPHPELWCGCGRGSSRRRGVRDRRYGERRESRRDVERIRLGIAALPVQITASLGNCGAAVSPRTAADPTEFLDELIRTADLAMYRSKRAGGNRIHRSDATATSP